LLERADDNVIPERCENMTKYVLAYIWGKKPKTVSTHRSASAAQKARTKLYKSGKYKGGLAIVGPRAILGSHSYHKPKKQKTGKKRTTRNPFAFKF